MARVRKLSLHATCLECTVNAHRSCARGALLKASLWLETVTSALVSLAMESSEMKASCSGWDCDLNIAKAVLDINVCPLTMADAATPVAIRCSSVGGLPRLIRSSASLSELATPSWHSFQNSECTAVAVTRCSGCVGVAQNRGAQIILVHIGDLQTYSSNLCGYTLKAHTLKILGFKFSRLELRVLTLLQLDMETRPCKVFGSFFNRLHGLPGLLGAG